MSLNENRRRLLGGLAVAGVVGAALAPASRAVAAPGASTDAAAAGATGVKRAGTASPSGAPRTVKWEELVPPDWDPLAAFQGKDLGTIREGSEADRTMMLELRKQWDQAPTRAELDGQRIRLPGFIVPLDMQPDGQMRQFLLVPYFGACIHSPPPPANQIVHVTMKAPAIWRAMETVWVAGTLSAQRQDSSMGVSGYALRADSVTLYREDQR